MKKFLILILTIILFDASTFSALADTHDCGAYYYGIGVKQDFKEAFNCYENETSQKTQPYQGDEDYIFLMMMYLNGEGVKRSVEKAKQILDSETEGKNENVGGYDLIREEIEKRLSDPEKTYKRIEYCDVAMSTLDINSCTQYQVALQEQVGQNLIQQIKKNLSLEEQKSLNLIDKYFEIEKKEDSTRIYLETQGSMRVMNADGHAGFLDQLHQDRIHDFLVEQNLKKYSKEKYQAIDKQLNEIYKSVISNDASQFLDEIKIQASMPSVVDDLKTDMKDTKEHTLNAQRAWIKYRDEWVVFLKVHKLKGFDNEETLANSIKARLTEERIRELKDGPREPAQ